MKKSAKTTFENGASRSHKAANFDMIPLVVLERLAARFELGLKYGRNNWQKGGPEFQKQCALHLVEHLWRWFEGEPDDDGGSQLDAVLWNAAALVWFETKKKKRVGPAFQKQATLKRNEKRLNADFNTENA